MKLTKKIKAQVLSQYLGQKVDLSKTEWYKSEMKSRKRFIEARLCAVNSNNKLTSACIEHNIDTQNNGMQWLDFSAFKLILRPLSEITNEDATNIAIMFHSTSLKSKYIKKYIVSHVDHEKTIKVMASNKDGDGIGGTVSIHYDLGYVCWENCEWLLETDNYELRLMQACQYLISKGYDMPHYLLDGKTLKEAGLAVYES